MARKRKEPKEPKAKDIKLAQPDRSAPTEKTLLDLANERDLFAQADERTRALKREQAKKVNGSEGADEDEQDPDVLSPGQERFLEAMLWTLTLAMLHLTFDVLVQHQYGRELVWPTVITRTSAAWAVFMILFYPLHPHQANKKPIPGVPLQYQKISTQMIFLAMSIICGCYLIHISNTYGYLAVMKQAPPLGCLWIWSVVELDLTWAVASLATAGGYMWWGGYSVY